MEDKTPTVPKALAVMCMNLIHEVFPPVHGGQNTNCSQSLSCDVYESDSRGVPTHAWRTKHRDVYESDSRGVVVLNGYRQPYLDMPQNHTL